jgi:NADH dehydrogenase [ubiquinone] 1 alpha subcomplex assembly factor 5
VSNAIISLNSLTLIGPRTALQLAEVEREGGISPHISPMTGNPSIVDLHSC